MTVTMADLAQYPLASTYTPRRIGMHLPAESAMGAMAGEGA
ncbi:hypothetical protein [Reyranella sp.]|nr:hypothetical protein [Reyranella sp.]